MNQNFHIIKLIFVLKSRQVGYVIRKMRLKASVTMFKHNIFNMHIDLLIISNDVIILLVNNVKLRPSQILR